MPIVLVSLDIRTRPRFQNNLDASFWAGGPLCRKHDRRGSSRHLRGNASPIGVANIISILLLPARHAVITLRGCWPNRWTAHHPAGRGDLGLLCPGDRTEGTDVSVTFDARARNFHASFQDDKEAASYAGPSGFTSKSSVTPPPNFLSRLQPTHHC